MIVDAIRTRLWPVPTFGVILAIAVGIGAPRLDTAVDTTLPPSVNYFLFGGGPGAARELLSVIAGSLVTVTALTFSLTVVTLQLASSQFSPRLLRTFARDRFVQRTLALFLATFVYALTVLRKIRGGTNVDPNFVPKISVTIAYLLALASVLGLVLFLAHLVREIRVETMLQNVRDDALLTANSLLPEHDSGRFSHDAPSPPPTAALIPAPCSGFLIHIDEQALLSTATELGAVVVLNRSPGGWLVAGTPVGVAWPAEPGGGFDDEDLSTLRERVGATLHTGNERTPVQDVGYALRQLADVAVKALSPGINDPTTAVHALGHSSSLLCDLARRDLGPTTLCDSDDTVRVVLEHPDLAEYLDLVMYQPRLYGASDSAVLSRLFVLLREVAWTTTDPAHRQAVSAQLTRLQQTVARQAFDDTERSQLGELGKDVVSALAGEWR